MNATFVRKRLAYISINSRITLLYGISMMAGIRFSRSIYTESLICGPADVGMQLSPKLI